jgi:hypothetical protein
LDIENDEIWFEIISIKKKNKLLSLGNLIKESNLYEKYNEEIKEKKL